MRSQILALLLAVGPIGAAVSDVSMEELIKKDYERLTGTFQLVSGVIDGKEVPEDVRRQTKLVTTMNRFTVSDAGQAGTSAAGTFKIDPTKSPNTADSLQLEGSDKGKTILGIYEIIDDNHKRALLGPSGHTAAYSVYVRTGQRTYPANLGTGEVAESRTR